MNPEDSMLFWCAVLFGLGVLAFLDSVFNMGEIFRQVNSIFFMLISLALLIRTTTKAKNKQIESFQERIFELENRVQQLKNDRQKLDSYY
jgi:uncharacterized membrane protein